MHIKNYDRIYYYPVIVLKMMLASYFIKSMSGEVRNYVGKTKMTIPHQPMLDTDSRDIQLFVIF